MDIIQTIKDILTFTKVSNFNPTNTTFKKENLRILVLDENNELVGIFISDINNSSSNDLQNSYNNSTSPQIVTSDLLGKFIIRNGSDDDTDTVFAIQNGEGDDTFSIQGDGTILEQGYKVLTEGPYPQTRIGGLTLGPNNSYPNDNWIALGTSVTFLNNYTAPASSHLNLIQLNYGISGSTSNDLVNHYIEIPTLNSGNQDQYRLLSFEYGINDAAQGVPLATYRANLEAGIAHAKGKNWPNNKILIINSNYCNPGSVAGLDVYANEALLIAKEQGVQFYDCYNYTFYNGGVLLLSDGIHPTTLGGIVYARGLVASLEGGMEITGGLTVDQQIIANGIKVLTGTLQVGPNSGSSGKLILSGDITSTQAVARGLNIFSNHVAGVNNQRVICLDINPTFNAGAFTGTQFIGINLNDIARIERQSNNTAVIFKFIRADNSQSSTFGHTGTGNYFLTKSLAVGSDLVGFPTTSGNLYVFARTVINSNVDDGIHRLQANGPISFTGSKSAIRTIIATGTAVVGDYTILCDATAGAITLNLPTAASAYSATLGLGQVYCIKKINNSANNITIDPNLAELIDGSATLVLSTYLQAVMIQSNGTSWFVIN